MLHTLLSKRVLTTNTVLKVFNSDIKNLLSMEDMWRSRAKPTPLDFDGITSGTFTLPQVAAQTNGSSASSHPKTNGHGNAAGPSTTTNGSSSRSGGAGLKDQRALTLADNLELFVARCVSQRLITFLAS